MVTLTKESKYAETPEAGKTKYFEGDTVIKASDLKEGSHIVVKGGNLTVEGDVTAKGVILEQSAKDRHFGDMVAPDSGVRIKGSLKADGAEVIGNNVVIDSNVSNAKNVSSEKNIDIGGETTRSNIRANGTVAAHQVTSSKIAASTVLTGDISGSEVEGQEKISAGIVTNSKLEVTRKSPLYAPTAVENLSGTVSVAYASNSDLTAKDVQISSNGQSVKIQADNVAVDGHITQSDVKANTVSVGTKDKTTTIKANPSELQSLEALANFKEPKPKVTVTDNPSLKDRIKGAALKVAEKVERVLKAKPETPQPPLSDALKEYNQAMDRAAQAAPSGRSGPPERAFPQGDWTPAPVATKPERAFPQGDWTPAPVATKPERAFPQGDWTPAPVATKPERAFPQGLESKARAVGAGVQTSVSVRPTNIRQSTSAPPAPSPTAVQQGGGKHRA